MSNNLPNAIVSIADHGVGGAHLLVSIEAGGQYESVPGYPKVFETLDDAKAHVMKHVIPMLRVGGYEYSGFNVSKVPPNTPVTSTHWSGFDSVKS